MAEKTKNKIEIFFYNGNLKELNQAHKARGLEYQLTSKKITHDSVSSLDSARTHMRIDLLQKGYSGVIHYKEFEDIYCGDTASYVEGVPVKLKEKK